MNKKHIFSVLLAVLMMVMTACGTGNTDTGELGNGSSAYDAGGVGETNSVGEADNVDETESSQTSPENDRLASSDAMSDSTDGQSSLLDDESAGDDEPGNDGAGDSDAQSDLSDDGSTGDDEAGNDGVGDSDAQSALAENESVGDDEPGNDGAGDSDAQPALSDDELADLPIYGENYYDVQNVVLYLNEYGELPPNYITKNEAQALGWEGGSVEEYQEGAAIGGDRFGNREGLLPSADGRTYTECDIDTNGRDSRGAKRLVFSNDGLYYYTTDHYESFQEVTITEENEVAW